MYKQRFIEIYGHLPQAVYAAPGRVELCGNHTDHQGGRVLAAAIDRAVRIYARKTGGSRVTVQSEGFEPCVAELDELAVKSEERNTSAALVRGVLAGLCNMGISPVGAELYVASDVPIGSGLSSSAAFSVAMAKCLSDLSGRELTKEQLAQLALYAENRYFMKPCGGLDQYASALGGAVRLDFSSPDMPKAKKLSLEWLEATHALCIVKVGADHCDLTDEYADIVSELRQICGVFGRERLSDVSCDEAMNRLPELRSVCGDRAVLRALHVFSENRRVDDAERAIREHSAADLAKALGESGHSSATLLQNIVPCGEKREQSAALAIALAGLALSDIAADGASAVRIHGGGFGGTVLCLVPKGAVNELIKTMEPVFGRGCVLTVRVDESGVRKEVLK